MEEALRADEPGEALVGLVRQLFAEGFDEGETYGVLQRWREQSGTEGREADEDRVLEVMDRLSGWCGSDAMLRRDPQPEVSS